MSKPALLQKLPLYAIAMAVAAIGLLPAAPAQADYACTQYGFPGDFAVKQSNGFGMSFVSKGTNASGTAIASAPGTTMSGIISGQITGRTVNLSVTWGTLPFSRGVYNGTVAPDGMVHGVTFDASRPSSTANWDSLIPLTCIQQAPTRPVPPGQGFPQFPRPSGF